MRACTADDDGHGGRDRPHGWPRPLPRRLHARDEGRSGVTRQPLFTQGGRVASPPTKARRGMNPRKVSGRAAAAVLSRGAFVQVRMRATGISGATADGAGQSLPWITTKSPSFASDLVRPLLGRVTRSRTISLEHGADDELAPLERSGWSWR